MTTERLEAIREAAITWHLRLQDGGDDDWAAFEAWLAEDGEHGRAYAQIENLDQDIGPLLARVDFRLPANDDSVDGAIGVTGHGQAGRRWWIFGGGVVAASILATLMVTLSPSPTADMYAVTTQAGEHQIVTLDEGTRVTLNGATRMAFKRGDARFARLEEGEALFHVRHDTARPFRLEVGERIVEDAGTLFNVLREGREIRVAVAEGRVIFNPGRDQAVLDAGSALASRDGERAVQRSSVPVASVGAWQRGRLVYRGEALSQAASGMARALGRSIRVSPAIASRPVHGTIMLDGDEASVRSRIEAALDVHILSDSQGWVIEPAVNGAR